MRNFFTATSFLCGFCVVSGLRFEPQPADARPTIFAAPEPVKKAAPPKKSALPKLARLEPRRGAYLGASLSFENLATEGVAGTMREKMTASMRDWESKSGRKHAIYLQFVPFPHDDGAFPSWTQDPKGWASSADFAQATSLVGATPMITLEPKRPHDFAREWKAGAPFYDATQRYAQAVGQWKKPIFIRFAHEMNGSWYPWAEWMDKNRNQKRDPGEDTGFTASDYRVAFRNVALMFRRHAPNAALVWCPNSGLLGGERRDVFKPWYPGDDVVDWVGLDVYERGWTMPVAGAKPWGGQFAHNLTHDMADDPKTPWNESVNFYLAFAQWKKKPMMIGETGATLSYRNDLNTSERATLNNAWKTGYFNANEYGWMQSVYGTTAYKAQPLLSPLDKQFPLVKAIVWFQIAKNEDVSAQGKDGKIRWFTNAYVDYRIGGGVEPGAPTANDELALYRRLINNSYFLSSVQR